MHAGTHAHTHTHTHTLTHNTYAHTHTHTHTHTHNTYARTHTYTHTHTLPQRENRLWYYLQLRNFPTLSAGVVDLEMEPILSLLIELQNHRGDVRRVGQTCRRKHTRVDERVNPFPTNDAHMCHGLSIRHKNLYGGFNTT